VQTVRKVVERVDNKVPVQVMKMVAEEQVRQVPVQVCKFVTEERVEPVSVQVCKYVTEERTMQVPRVVEKKTPYTYTVRSPRTVAMRVPLDPCGNPIPSAAAPMAAPAAAARPMAAPTAAPALQTPPSGPVKTFSDKPADAPAKAAEGWHGSSLDHVDPTAKAGAVRADRPVDDNAALKPIETIPAPAAKQDAVAPAPKAPATPEPTPEPTVAPLGPAVEPAPPAADTRDVPAAETSSGLRRIEVASGDQST
jgi:hypothetical protein